LMCGPWRKVEEMGTALA